jgi:hypothetical protein
MFKPELLHIVSYKLLNLNIEDLNDVENEDFIFDLDNSIELGFNEQNNLIRAIIKINITKRLESNEEIIANAKIIVEYVFLVDNFKELHKTDEDGVIGVDLTLTHNISVISYSTTRGLIIERFKDSPFDGFILPVIDINSDIKTNANK